METQASGTAQHFFFAILYSRVPIIDAPMKKNVDSLRIMRNTYFGHVTSSQLLKQEFDDLIADLIQIFTALGFNTNDITDVETKTLETFDFKTLLEELKTENEKNDEFDKRLGLVEGKVDNIEVMTNDQGATIDQHTDALSQLSADCAGLEVITTEQDATIGQHTDALSQISADCAGLEVITTEQGATIGQHTDALSQLSADCAGLEVITTEQGATLGQHTDALSQLSADCAGLEMITTEQGATIEQHIEVLSQHSEALQDLSQQVKFRRDKEENNSVKEPQQSHGANINMYGCNVVIGIGATIQEEGACGTSQNLTDESQLLKNYYNDVYSKHAVTVVSEDRKHIDRDERNIRDFAVEVAIAERGEIDDDVNNERLKFIQKMDSIRNTSKIELSDLLGEERITYIRGVAGIGKTVLGKQIALKWANNEIYKDFSFVLLIESRDLSDSKLNLEDFMKDRSFPNPEQINARDILFIIDGLDEVENLHDELRQSDSKLSQLLNCCKKFRESKFILTGRPHVERVLKQAVTLIGKMKVFEVCGLSEDSIGNYISMFTKQNQAKIDEIKKARDASESVKSTLHIPQYLNTFCCASLMTGGKAIRNVTELYVWLLFIFLAQHFNKKNDTEIEPAALFGKFSTLILELGRISFNLLEKKKIIFTKKEFKSTLQEIEADEEMAEAFQSFCCVRSEGYQVQKRYQFLHLTLQEFLASVFCYVKETQPEYLIKNDNYEIIVFLSGFHGTKLETEDQEEDTMMKIFVKGCLEMEKGLLSWMLSKIKVIMDEPFIIKLLKGLKDGVDDERIRLERAIACLCEYLSNRSKYCNQTHVGKVMKELIHVGRRHEDSKGRSMSIFVCESSIAQSNFVTVLDICETYDSLCKFKNVDLRMFGLLDFGLCKYFNYFGFVRVSLFNPESVDKFNLFLSYCKYCNTVRLDDCKIVGYLELDKLSRELGGANDELRLENLSLNNCEIDEKNWIGLCAVIVKMKRVWLEGIKIEERQWRSLADVIEEEKKDQRLKLEVLALLRYCEIDEKNWIGLCAVIVKMKAVVLEEMKMEESHWRSLADVIEEEKKDQRLKLKQLRLWFCNIDMELVERIRKAGVKVDRY